MRFVFKSLLYSCCVVVGFLYQSNLWAVDSGELAHAVKSALELKLSSDLIDLKLVSKDSPLPRRCAAHGEVAPSLSSHKLLIMAPIVDSGIDALRSIELFIEEQASYKNSFLVLKKSNIPLNSLLARGFSCGSNVTVLVINDAPSLLPGWFSDVSWVVQEVDNTACCPCVKFDESDSKSTSDEDYEVDSDDDDYAAQSRVRRGCCGVKRAPTRLRRGEKSQAAVCSDGAKKVQRGFDLTPESAKEPSREMRRTAFYDAIYRLLYKILPKDDDLFVVNELGVSFSTKLSQKIVSRTAADRHISVLVTSLNNYKRVIQWKNGLNLQNWTVVFLADDEDAINSFVPSVRPLILHELSVFNKFMVASKNLEDNGYRCFFKDPKTGSTLQQFLYPKAGKSSSGVDSPEKKQQAIAAIIFATLKSIECDDFTAAAMSEKTRSISGGYGGAYHGGDDLALSPLEFDPRRNEDFGGGGGAGCGQIEVNSSIPLLRQEDAFGDVLVRPESFCEVEENHAALRRVFSTEGHILCFFHKNTTSLGRLACSVTPARSDDTHLNLEEKTIATMRKVAVDFPSVIFVVILTTSGFGKELKTENLRSLLAQENVYFVFSDPISVDTSLMVKSLPRAFFHTQEPILEKITVYKSLSGRLEVVSSPDSTNFIQVIERCVEQLVVPECWGLLARKA